MLLAGHYDSDCLLSSPPLVRVSQLVAEPLDLRFRSYSAYFLPWLVSAVTLEEEIKTTSNIKKHHFLPFRALEVECGIA